MEKSGNVIWKDRKRILGMPITFTRYWLSDDRLFIKTGLFNLEEEEVILYRVRDLSLKRTLGQRIFGVGSVLVHSTDKSAPHLLLKNIRHVEEVKELIHKQVEEMKIARKIRIGEVMETHDNDNCGGDFDDADDISEDLADGEE